MTTPTEPHRPDLGARRATESTVPESVSARTRVDPLSAGPPAPFGEPVGRRTESPCAAVAPGDSAPIPARGRGMSDLSGVVAESRPTPTAGDARARRCAGVTRSAIPDPDSEMARGSGRGGFGYGATRRARCLNSGGVDVCAGVGRTNAVSAGQGPPPAPLLCEFDCSNDDFGPDGPTAPPCEDGSGDEPTPSPPADRPADGDDRAGITDPVGAAARHEGPAPGERGGGDPIAGDTGPALPEAEDRWAAMALTMSEPGEFIAAVPALLGFRPQRSLVVCLLLRSRKYPGAVYLGALARHDLDVAGCGAWVRLAGQLAAICGQEDAVGVLALIIDDRATAPRAGGAGRRGARHRDLVRTLDGALRARGVTLAQAWAVADIAADADWWTVLDTGHRGSQSDPAASPVALAQVLDGRPIRASRTELTAVVAEDAAMRDRIDAVIGAATEAAQCRFRHALRDGAPRSYSRAALEMVLWHIGTVESGDELDPPELADLAVAVRDGAVRDSLFAVAMTEHAAAAEALWARACRGLGGLDRAEMATLLGYSAYTRGDGPLAGVAFDAALAADPAHRIAQLLDAALRTGMRPADVRKLACSGRDTAAGLGVDLGITEPYNPPTEGTPR